MEKAINYLAIHQNEISIIVIIIYLVGISIFVKNAWSSSVAEALKMEKMKLPMIFNFIGACLIVLQLYLGHIVGG